MRATVLLAVALATGCAAQQEARLEAAPSESYRQEAIPTAGAPAPAMAYSDSYEAMSEMSEPEPRSAPASAPRAPTSKARSAADGPVVHKQAQQQTQQQPHQQGQQLQQAQVAQPKPQRMVHYNGFVRVKVTTPQETLEQAARLADEIGGYIEAQSGTTITLRVPVARVREAFDALLELGDVVARSLTAQDVTDAFTAAELRLKTMRASRDRLIELLARAKDEHEKLSLLREIQRLTEQIDQLDLQVKTLASLAAYSRLTLEAIAKQAHTGGRPEDLAAFRWIHELSPFRRDIAHSGDTLELSAPDGMVVLDDREHWIAESADGAVIWSSERENEPRGSTEFWVAALKARLGAEYGNAEVVKVGRFELVRVVDASEKAYRYLVGVEAEGEGLRVVEIYYPTPAHEERHRDAVRSALERGET